MSFSLKMRLNIYFKSISSLTSSQQLGFSKNTLTVTLVKIIIWLRFTRVFVILGAFLHYRERVRALLKCRHFIK